MPSHGVHLALRCSVPRAFTIWFLSHSPLEFSCLSPSTSRYAVSTFGDALVLTVRLAPHLAEGWLPKLQHLNHHAVLLLLVSWYQHLSEVGRFLCVEIVPILTLFEALPWCLVFSRSGG